MDLKSGYPFWPIKSGLIRSYPALAEDLTCDVAIIGGGITGALVAYYLSEAGARITVLDRRDIGTGSTSASTALLQYEVDTPLTELATMVGEVAAARSYMLCRDAISTIGELTRAIGDDCGFAPKKSLYFASSQRDAKAIEREYAARRAIGIYLDLLDRSDIEHRFSFSAPCALLSRDGAQVDAYRLCHALLAASAARGATVADRTAVTKIEQDGGGVTLRTDRGPRVTARKLVFASGFESQQYLRKKMVDFKATYALISEPLATFPGWGEEQCLIWESARPYIYMRTTDDGRVLVGGEDDSNDNELKRDRSLGRKTRRLGRRFAGMFPAITLDVAYSWAGTFGETKDGLAYIGETSEYPNAYFALGYGGNGITYSVIAAQMIRDAFLGHQNPDAQIFRFDR